MLNIVNILIIVSALDCSFGVASLSDNDRISELEKMVERLARQVMEQQLFVEERIRSDGNSGLKQVGLKSYKMTTHNGMSFAVIQDKASYTRTVGMGEFIAVLNGVEFRTRHNDYRLRRPSTTNGDYHATQDIEFPPVPQSVIEQPTTEKQINELREYFKAWKDQDPTHRNYKPYFKPVLCYLEGAWTNLDDSSESNSHNLGGSEWTDLLDKIRFISYTGAKNKTDNLDYLPTTIINIENGKPKYAQWNYRILCHPLQTDVPLKVFTPADDLFARLSLSQSLETFAKTEGARFYLNEETNEETYDFKKAYGGFEDKSYKIGLLDKLMMEIPGKNNYKTFRQEKTNSINPFSYHRVLNNGGNKVPRYRGYADQYLWVAETTQPNVAEMKVKYYDENNGFEPIYHSARCSYAIPLEIIYLNPLHQWNPYNLRDQKNEHFVTENGRNGGLTTDKAYNGTGSKYFFKTPSEFFSADSTNGKNAERSVGVLDGSAVVRKVRASGIRIVLPEFEGIGKIRMRYPIFPLHAEGSQNGKELSAIKAAINHMQTMSSVFTEQPKLETTP